ncbi:MAG: Ribosomal small subunit methyltransferase [Parcubacteria group bacterium]|nr:Ribosomal small subunit methyltransferase [Parcubacteria group bacterium]
MEPRHDTVFLKEAVETLGIRPGDVAVDGTLGAAGHFRDMAIALGASGTLVGIDADSASIERAQNVVNELGNGGPTVHLINDNFRNLGRILDDLNLPCLDRALFDLGWNGFQLANGRGFSFRADEPLLMTYGDPATAETTAADIVNSMPEDELADLIFTLGEERFSRGIARSIVETRKKARIFTTLALAEAVERGTPGWYQNRRLHPATKTFQALRIATNDELGALREGLAAAMERLTQGGRIAVITFHSIEDRIVKSAMKDAAYAGQGTVITRKPIVPSSEELAANPRSRSAKLRVFERCNGEGVCITKETNEYQHA